MTVDNSFHQLCENHLCENSSSVSPTRTLPISTTRIEICSQFLHQRLFTVFSPLNLFTVYPSTFIHRFLIDVYSLFSYRRLFNIFPSTFIHCFPIDVIYCFPIDVYSLFFQSPLIQCFPIDVYSLA